MQNQRRVIVLLRFSKPAASSSRKANIDRDTLDVSSIAELTQRKQGDPLFDGLLRRIVEGSGTDGYVLPADATSNEIAALGHR